MYICVYGYTAVLISAFLIYRKGIIQFKHQQNPAFKPNPTHVVCCFVPSVPRWDEGSLLTSISVTPINPLGGGRVRWRDVDFPLRGADERRGGRCLFPEI